MEVAAPCQNVQDVVAACQTVEVAMDVEVATHVVDVEAVQTAYQVVVLLDAAVVHHAYQAVADVEVAVNAAKEHFAVEIKKTLLI